MGNRTIRLRWYSWLSLYPLCGVAFFVGVGFFNHGLFGVAAIVAVAWGISMFATKVEVTPTHLRRSAWLGRPQAARRDEICAVHWYGRTLTFVNDGQRAVLGFSSFGWTRGQLLDLSEVLGVPLYDHRTRHGRGPDDWEGQLVQRAG